VNPGWMICPGTLLIDRYGPKERDQRSIRGRADAGLAGVGQHPGWVGECRSTPGNLPGSFKNLLDWTVGGGEMYGKPVAWINVAAEGRGMGAQDALASVLGYLGATAIQPACRRIPVARAAIGPDGLVTDPRFQAGVAEIWQALSHLSND
jgi:hypothetical protein